MINAWVGKKAPDFEVPAFVNNSFRNVKLSDYSDKWVALFFYSGDFTFVCPTALSAIALRKDVFEKLGVQVLAMSTDSHFTHEIWQGEELSKMVPGGFPYPLLSDFDGTIGKLYGVYDEVERSENRGRFLIDPAGIIQLVEVTTPWIGQNIREFIRQIVANQHFRATGEPTPDGWRPGEATIKPDPDLVGRVWEIWKPRAF